MLEDWRARLISVELRKVILVASQFFEFSAYLGSGHPQTAGVYEYTPVCNGPDAVKPPL